MMASYTSGWALTTASTSSVKIFSPPELMHTESRPSSVMVPSASRSTLSPATAYRVPSGPVTNVAADFSGSLW